MSFVSFRHFYIVFFFLFFFVEKPIAPLIIVGRYEEDEGSMVGRLGVMQHGLGTGAWLAGDVTVTPAAPLTRLPGGGVGIALSQSDCGGDNDDNGGTTAMPATIMTTNAVAPYAPSSTAWWVDTFPPALSLSHTRIAPRASQVPDFSFRFLSCVFSPSPGDSLTPKICPPAPPVRIPVIFYFMIRLPVRFTTKASCRARCVCACSSTSSGSSSL